MVYALVLPYKKVRSTVTEGTHIKKAIHSRVTMEKIMDPNFILDAKRFSLMGQFVIMIIKN